jgi:hypothetical protein
MTAGSAAAADGRPRAAVPWTFSDARWLFTGTLVSAGMLVAAWWGASGTGRVGRQTGWVVVAVIGVVVSAVSNAWWLLSARQAVHQRAREFVARAESLPPVHPPTSEESALMWVPGTVRYHRPECLLVAGKTEAVAASSADHEAAGRRRCEVCKP